MVKVKGRPRRNWLSFEEARRLVRDEAIAHRADYYRWYEYNRPGQIPKYPQSAYKDQWIGWNDWLGNDNTFKGVKRQYRPFLEAVAYVHSLHLKTSTSWFEYIREHGIPDDVPSRPELVYKDSGWISWPHWIGNTVSGRIAAQQEIVEEAGILYLVSMPGRPANVIRVGVELGGRSALQDAQSRQGFRVIKLFNMRVGYDWRPVVLQYARPWWENDAEYVVSNIHELLFDLGMDLDPV